MTAVAPIAPDGEDRARQTAVIADLLEQTYGPRPWRRHLPPVDELVATILSQHTSDTNTERAFASLRARFPAWTDVIQAPTDDVVEAIRSGGLANQKAPRIQSVLREILDRYGSFDLDALASLPVAQARAELTSLHGIGPKTASCVLLFSLGMPALPVDTHVHRVTRRLGLIDDKLSAEAAHVALESLLGGGRDEVYAFHMHLIGHGRLVCTARRPACERCSLAGYCDYVKRRATTLA
ncbi:MAG: endonuclease III [Thermomicrobiales bacterium]|nr:endonuclease III [Thermomicrobiales bacterium]